MPLHYAEPEHNGQKHHMSWNNNCGCFVCHDEGCGLHANLTSRGEINQTFAQCWCGWGVKTSVHEEFGSEFEDV